MGAAPIADNGSALQLAALSDDFEKLQERVEKLQAKLEAAEGPQSDNRS